MIDICQMSLECTIYGPEYLDFRSMLGHFSERAIQIDTPVWLIAAPEIDPVDKPSRGRRASLARVLHNTQFLILDDLLQVWTLEPH
jgi:hypothetical protein